MARAGEFRIGATTNARELAERLLGVGRDAEFALASALRATANAARTETRRKLAEQTGYKQKVFQKRIAAYLRRERSRGLLEGRTWVGKKVHIYPRHHASVASDALAKGYQPRETIGVRIGRPGDYVRRAPNGQLEIYRYDMDRTEVSAALSDAARKHMRTTMRRRLAREIDRRLARRAGGKLARNSIGFHEARMRRLIAEANA